MRTAGTRFHPTADAVAARVQAIAARRRAGKYLRTAITAGTAGKPVLAWHFDQDAIDAEAAGDGWYALLTNLEPSLASPAEVFRRYKGQHVVERRYGEFKGPLAVAPLFLKTQPAHHRPDHRDLPGPADLLPGRAAGPPSAGPARRDDDRPARLRPRPGPPHRQDHLPALADLRLIPAHDGNPATIPKPVGVQARLLDLLKIDISRPRWLTQ